MKKHDSKKPLTGIRVLTAVLCFLLQGLRLAAAAWGNEGQVAAGLPAYAGPLTGLNDAASMGITVIKVLASLGVVIGLMLIAVRLIKKAGLTGTQRRTSLVNIMDTRMIAPKKYVSVLEIAGEFVVVGVTDNQINLLTKLSNSCELNKLSSNQTYKTEAPSFAGLLDKAVKAVRGKTRKTS